MFTDEAIKGAAKGSMTSLFSFKESIPGIDSITLNDITHSCYYYCKQVYASKK